MKLDNLFLCFAIAVAMFGASMPAQAGMVATGQLQQSADLTGFMNISQQREWIEQRLLEGGVGQGEASVRVAAMTDAEIARIYQRVDSAPAGGNILIIALIIFLVLEVTGYIDVIPNK